MKKIILILVTGFLTMGIFSCTMDDENILSKKQEPQLCCGEEGEILPPPPPPPPTTGEGNKNEMIKD